MRSSLLGLVLLVGCVSDAVGTQNDSGVADTGIASDGMMGSDAACTPGCADAMTLRSCAQADQSCALGCSTTPMPHCAVLQPASPVTPDDLTAPNVGDLVASMLTVIHTDTGAIDGVRAANANPNNYEVVSNIGFRLFAGVNIGVFTVKNFTVNASTVATVRGKAALAIVAGDKIKLTGTLDARGWTSNGGLCGSTAPIAVGPGGTAAGNGAGNNGIGAGGGHGADEGGGGGGGFGGKGGDGQPNNTESPPMSLGGSAVAFALPIAGGFGAGSMGAGVGGGGGGAVELVAGNEIQIGGGGAAGGINVGGCGGEGGKNNSTPATGGGGGGSGGEILLQSPLVTFLANGVLAANGGAGGSGAGAGGPGLLSDQPAQPVATAKGPGGKGSAGATLAGSNSTGALTSSFGGGGGGGAGRIRIDNATGMLTLGTAIISPSVGSMATTTTKVASK